MRWDARVALAVPVGSGEVLASEDADAKDGDGFFAELRMDYAATAAAGRAGTDAAEDISNGSEALGLAGRRGGICRGRDGERGGRRAGSSLERGDGGDADSPASRSGVGGHGGELRRSEEREGSKERDAGRPVRCGILHAETTSFEVWVDGWRASSACTVLGVVASGRGTKGPSGFYRRPSSRQSVAAGRIHVPTTRPLHPRPGALFCRSLLSPDPRLCVSLLQTGVAFPPSLAANRALLHPFSSFQRCFLTASPPSCSHPAFPHSHPPTCHQTSASSSTSYPLF